MLTPPVLQGLIKRRVLVNYRVAPDVAARLLPAPFRPQILRGWAHVGVCLIRLEKLRPAWLPCSGWLSSENAAHRMAVEWQENGVTRHGVYVFRRDTSLWLNHLVGGRLFPGVHHLATFEVADGDGRLDFAMTSGDGTHDLRLRARETEDPFTDSCFDSLADASAFYQTGCSGYSPAGATAPFQGVALEIERWEIHPLQVENLTANWFEDETRFPAGSLHFDHALLMRDRAHRWSPLPSLNRDNKSFC